MIKIKDKEVVKELSFARQEIGCDPDLKAFQIAVRNSLPSEKKGSIFLSDQARHELENRNIGRVVAIGPLAFSGETEKHYKVDIGDWVWYSHFDKVRIDGANCRAYFMNDNRILGRIREEDLEAVLDGAS